MFVKMFVYSMAEITIKIPDTTCTKFLQSKIPATCFVQVLDPNTPGPEPGRMQTYPPAFAVTSFNSYMCMLQHIDTTQIQYGCY